MLKDTERLSCIWDLGTITFISVKKQFSYLMEPFRLDVIYVNKMSETFSKCALHVNLDIMYVKADIHAYVNAY